MGDSRLPVGFKGYPVLWLLCVFWLHGNHKNLISEYFIWAVTPNSPLNSVWYHKNYTISGKVMSDHKNAAGGMLHLVALPFGSATKCNMPPSAFWTMEWLRLVGSLKLQVSFAEYRLFYSALLQKRPIILRSLLIVATSYPVKRDTNKIIWKLLYSAE